MISERMVFMFRQLAAASLLCLAFTTGCTTGSNRQAAGIVAPGNDWMIVGSQVGTKDANIVVTAGEDTPDQEDMTLSLHFSFAVLAHRGDDSERAKGLSLSGTGARPEDAYTIPGLKAQVYAIEVALTFITKQYPAHQNLRAYLLNGPGTKYVGQFDFISDGQPHRAYFDLTPWADAIKGGA
jgi:hypothetical protein